jgi:DNA-binding GntR family transcriptional regulator
MDRFKLKDGSKLLEIEKVFLADGDPIIYCINHIPDWVFGEAYSAEAVVEPGLTEPILDFLEMKCGQSVAYYVSSAIRSRRRACAGWPRSSSGS